MNIKDRLFYFGLDSSLFIDFSVWVLLVDGLNVSPFSHHENSERILQDLGMNSESWISWFHRIVDFSNPCLFWENDEFNPLLTHRDDSRRKMYEAQMLDQNKRYLSWQLNQFEIAFKKIDNVSLLRATPDLIWNGNQLVKNRLSELWESYIINPMIENIKNDVDYEIIKNVSKIMINDFSLDVLQLFLVSYPKTVHLAVSPSSIVIGVNNSTTTDKILLHLEEGIKQLSS